MNKLGRDLKAVFIDKNIRLFRKTYFYYFLICFIVLCGINLVMIHDLRLNYLAGLYNSIPRTHEIKSAVLLADYGTRLTPKAVWTWGLLAESLHQIGDLPGAVHAYQKAISLEPTDQGLRFALAEVYRELHQEEKAEAVLDPLSRALP